MTVAEAQAEALVKHRKIIEALNILLQDMPAVQIIGAVLVNTQTSDQRNGAGMITTHLPLMAGHLLDFGQFIKLLQSVTDTFETQLARSRGAAVPTNIGNILRSGGSDGGATS